MKEIQRNDKLGRGFLFGGILAARVLPYILHIVILVLTKRSLGTFSYELCNVLGVVCCIVMGYFAFAYMGFIKIKDYISCCTMLFLAVAAMEFGEWLVQYTASNAYEFPWVILLAYGVVAIVVTFLASMGLLNGLRKPLVMLCVMLMCLGFSAGELLVERVFELASGFIKESFSANMIKMLLMSLVEAMILYGIMLYVRKRTDSWSKGEYVLVKRNLPFWIALLILLGIMGIQELVEKPEDAIFVDLQDDLARGDIALVNGNLDIALESYERALTYVEAWKYALGEEYNVELLDKVIASQRELQINLIHWEKTEDINGIGEYLLYENTQLELAIRYVDMLYEAYGTDLSEWDEIIRDEIIGLMIVNNKFQDEILSIDDIEDREDEILDKLEEFEDVEVTYQVVKLMSETGKAGKVTRDAVYKMLDLADENDDNIFIQRMAVIYGNALRGDNAGHYDRTINAAMRYEDLYSDMDDVSDEDMIACKIMVAQWILELGNYQTALEYLKEVLEEENNMNAVVLAARCYDELGMSKECREMAELILEETPDNAAAIYYCAITYLKEGNVDEALEYTVKLCEVMESANGDEKRDAEVCLYSMLQYLTVDDWSVGYSYRVYGRLTEEQMAIITQNQVLHYYIQAVYDCLYARNYEEALVNIEAVIESQGYMSQLMYLQGAAYYGMKDFEKAVDAYKISLEIEPDSPTVWYALANAYDALERYEEAYEAALQVELLLPETDHEFDLYGVGIHNGWLLERLEEQIGR